MPRTKKKVETPESVTAVVACSALVADVDIPATLQDRFAPQLEKVSNRLQKIATNLAKAIELEATKGEREAKKAERKAKKVEKLSKQITAAQDKLKELTKK